MKNKGLIITLIVILSVIALCLISFLIFALEGKINFTKGIYFDAKKSENILIDEEYDIETIKDIEILLDSGDIKIEESNNAKIKLIAYGEKIEDINVTMTNGKIKIEHLKRKKSWINFQNYKNDMIIYIPTNYAGSIKIKNDYGNINAVGLENSTLDIDSDYGNVKIGRINNAYIKSDYGNIEVEEILNKCKIEADYGNIKINKISIQEDSNIKADLGNVDIEEINNVYVDAKLDLGKANITGSNRYAEITLKIECDLGNVNVGK